MKKTAYTVHLSNESFYAEYSNITGISNH